MFKAPKTSNGSTASGPASLFEQGLPSSSGLKFSSGRGGAGNIRLNSQKAPYSFDEELNRQATRAHREMEGAAWHVGRGGAGNYASTQTSRKDSISSK